MRESIVVEEFDSPHSSLWLFAVSVALAIYSFLRVFTNSLELVFPQLPSGTYVGSISGLSTSKLGKLSAEHATLHIETLDDGRSLALTIFLEDVKTQSMHLRERSVSESGANANRDAFLPVRFAINNVSYMLYGSRSRASWSGGVIASDGGAGKWFLERLPKDVFIIPEVPNVELRKWMFFASQNKILEEEFASMATQINAAKALLVDLQKAASSKENLQQRIEGKVPELNEQIKLIHEGNSQMTKEVNESVKELDLLSRLSKRGKIVLLSRRILNRERGWYFANWPVEFAGTAGSQSSVEDLRGDMKGLDLEELEVKFEKAQQTASIYDKMQREKQEIRRLNKKLLERSSQEVGNTTKGNNQKQEEDTGSFWDRLFR